MTKFKLGAFWVGKPLVSIEVEDDVTLAEVLENNGYSYQSHVDCRGKQLDVTRSVWDLNLEWQFAIVKWEVKTSWATAKDEIELLKSEIDKLKKWLAKYEWEEKEYVIVPQPILSYPEGKAPEFVASSDQQLMEWITQFADSHQIKDIQDTDGNSVSPFSNVENGKQYVIVLA